VENNTPKAGDPMQFMHVVTPEPHLSRGKSLIKAHPEVRKLMGRNIWSAALGAGIVLGQCLTAFALGHAPYSYWPFALAVAWGLGAFANHALYVLIHEGTHGLVFRSQFLNKAFVIFCDFPNLLPGAIGFRHHHLIHHSHPHILGIDADLASPWEVRLIGRGMLSKALWLLAFPIFQALRPLGVENPGLLGPWFVANIAANAAFAVALWFVVGPLGLGYLLASFWFAVGLHPLGARWIQEHYTLDTGQETRSYYGPINILSLNVGYHNEHHDLPSVPWNRLPKLTHAAPEFYRDLRCVLSLSGLLVEFLTDRRYSLASRIVRDRR
jgi:sphingolipid 4-desaturase/C4-monooxygenase